MDHPAFARFGRVRSAVLVWLPVVSLVVLLGPSAGAEGGVAGQADPAAASTYSLAATVSPPPLTDVGCRRDVSCALVTASGSGGDDQPTLARAVNAAAGGAAAGASGSATVFLGTGTFRLGRPLVLPPNVNLRGSGITGTTLLIMPSGRRNFLHTFMIKPADGGAGSGGGSGAGPGSGAGSGGGGNLVADLTVNGNCVEGAGAPRPEVPPALGCDPGVPADSGGGVAAGDRWTIRQVRFTNLGYFKLWIFGTRDTRAVDDRFDGWGGAGASGNDNIGGGGDAAGAVIEHNQFDRTIRGNSIDLTNATAATIRYNTVLASRELLSARGVSDYASVYLEGVTSSIFAANRLDGAHLVVQSNSRYGHEGRNAAVTDPLGVVVTGNRFTGSFHTGVTVTYDDYHDQGGASHILRAGGGNTITNNVIVRPAGSGILVIGCDRSVKDTPDTIVGNTVRDAGYGGEGSLATGCGTFDTVGIGISVGDEDRLYGNTITDDQAVQTTRYGIELGAEHARTRPSRTRLTGPGGGAPNVVRGARDGPYRTIGTGS
jgi:trimeric autotransporter adhesin